MCGVENILKLIMVTVGELCEYAKTATTMNSTLLMGDLSVSGFYLKNGDWKKKKTSLEYLPNLLDNQIQHMCRNWSVMPLLLLIFTTSNFFHKMVLGFHLHIFVGWRIWGSRKYSFSDCCWSGTRLLSPMTRKPASSSGCSHPLLLL